MTEKPTSTLVATGTGSGKTECFIYPILDHVLAHPAQRGVKAIILYPMNALAGDQARRFAKMVHNNPACFGKVRIGLYVGGKGEKSKQMTDTDVITCRDEMRKSPPDILAMRIIPAIPTASSAVSQPIHLRIVFWRA